MTDECNFDTRPLNAVASDKCQSDVRQYRTFNQILDEQYELALKRIAELELFIETHGLEVPQ